MTIEKLKLFECTISFKGTILARNEEHAKEEFASALGEYTGLTEHITVKEIK